MLVPLAKNTPCAICYWSLRPVQTERVIRRRIGRFNARVKRGRFNARVKRGRFNARVKRGRFNARVKRSQLENSVSYCVLRRSERASENTHLLCKGKYHCTADLLFDRLGFGQRSKSVYSFNSTKQLNPNQSNRRSAIQWYFPYEVSECSLLNQNACQVGNIFENLCDPFFKGEQLKDSFLEECHLSWFIIILILWVKQPMLLDNSSIRKHQPEQGQDWS